MTVYFEGKLSAVAQTKKGSYKCVYVTPEADCVAVFRKTAPAAELELMESGSKDFYQVSARMGSDVILFSD